VSAAKHTPNTATPHVLAVEPDLRQAAILKRVLKEQLRAELTLVDTRDAAIAAIDARVPDVILLTALLSPRDEDELFAHLRALDGAAHVQTHTIPQLAGTATDAPERSNGKGMLGRLRRQKADPEPIAGCDPAMFAEEVAAYLQRAAELRTQQAAPKKRVKAVKAEPAQQARHDTASAPEAPGGGESAWASPFEWRPAADTRAAAVPADTATETPPSPLEAEPAVTTDDTEREDAERARQQEEWLKINAERERMAAERRQAEAERQRQEAEAAAAREREEERQRALEALREREAERMRIEAEREAEQVRLDAEREAERVRQEAERVRAEAEQEAQRLKQETELHKQEAEAAAARQREAERLRQEAEREKERLRVEAERAKERLRVEAEREAERVRRESERVRLEAERARLEAEREVERKRLDAEAAAARQREAERQRLEAERAKERVRQEAEREKERLRAEAVREAERVRLEAERLRKQAEREAEQLRLEAEREAERLRAEAERHRVEPGPVAPPPSPAPAKTPPPIDDPFAEFRDFTEFQPPADIPSPQPRAVRLAPLSMWARIETPRTQPPAPPRDELAELMKGLTLPATVAGVGYARGCRIRRVRVPAATEELKATKGPIILSRAALAEMRSNSV
jgi:hypothetical protein